MLHLKKG